VRSGLAGRADDLAADVLAALRADENIQGISPDLNPAGLHPRELASELRNLVGDTGITPVTSSVSTLSS
jgi:hypothetical protein